MKIGSDPEADLGRVRAAREAIGSEIGLFVDANGAYSENRRSRRPKNSLNLMCVGSRSQCPQMTWTDCDSCATGHPPA